MGLVEVESNSEAKTSVFSGGRGIVIYKSVVRSQFFSELRRIMKLSERTEATKVRILSSLW